LITLYCSCVRSVLEYNFVVWSSPQLRLSDELEKIQRILIRFLNSKLNIEDICTTDLSKQYNLLSLFVRRLINDITFVFKLLNNVIDCPELLPKISMHVPQRLSRSNATFYIPLHHCNYIINSPFSRMLGYCNKYSLKIDLFNATPIVIKSSILK